MAAEQKTDEAFKLTLKEQFCRRCPAFALGICRAGVEAFASEKTTALSKVKQMGWSVLARRLVFGDHDLDEVIPLICNGWAAWYVNVPGDNRQIISFILPGELISAAVVFEPIEYCRVEAITDVQYRTFTRSELIGILFKRPGDCEEILRDWVEEKRRSDQLIVDLGRHSAEERILQLILQLVERVKARGTIESYKERIPFPLRHHHIADAAGLTPVHVSKALSELRRRNILVIQNRSLSILDPIAFHRLAGKRPS